MSVSSKLGRWCQIPVSVYADTEEGLRHATWLELFFDLVFVVAIAELGSNLHHDLTVVGLAEFVVLFAIVWWVWATISYFADVFNTNDPMSVAMIIASMFGVIFLSQTIGNAFHGGSFAFAVAVLLLRGYLTVAHVRARHLRVGMDRGEQRFLEYWIGLEVLVTVVWGLSLVVPEPGRYGLWLASFVLGVAGMATIYLNFERIIAPTISHCSERLGLFTILVLGETILAVAVGISFVAFSPMVLLISGLAFSIAVSAWWVYFYRYDERAWERLIYAQGKHWKQRRPRGITHIYAHVLVHAGIVVTGIGIAVALESAFSNHALPTGGRLALCVGLAAFLLGTTISQRLTLPSWLDGRVAAGRLSVIGLFGLLAVGGGALSPSALVGLLALSMVGLVVFEGLSIAAESHPVAEGVRSDGGEDP